MNVIGCDLTQLDTPALWVDLDLMDGNINRLADFFSKTGVSWRPHTKGIKIPAIAHKLISAGAIGVTCAKLSEAEVMASSGIKDILIANQIVGEQKITRLVNLRRHADVIVAVDDLGNAEQISQAAINAGVRVRVVIEVNTGMNRCGLEPGAGVVPFASQLGKLPGIEFAGLMGWEGHTPKIENPEEKVAAVEKAVDALLQTARLCREAGLPVAIISCGGTGTLQITPHIDGITEIQAGGVVFGDMTYRKWGAGMDCSLFILATIISRPQAGRFVVDAGRKAMNAEYVFPVIKDMPEAKTDNFSAEHIVFTLTNPNNPCKVGDKVNLTVGYEDLTVFLHDQLYGVRKGKIEVVWNILGRGKLT